MTHLRLVARARPLPAPATPSQLTSYPASYPNEFAPKSAWRNSREVSNDVFYRQWSTTADDDELEQLARLREKLAPGQVVTMHNLIRMCFARPRRLPFVPESLVLALKANQWSHELATVQFDPRRRSL